MDGKESRLAPSEPAEKNRTEMQLVGETTSTGVLAVLSELRTSIQDVQAQHGMRDACRGDCTTDNQDTTYRPFEMS